jgi:hypothetical protein
LTASARYVRHPVLLARLWGFNPTNQMYTALEVIAADLCWVPPLVGALAERCQRVQLAAQ